jgi:hypothetical protein
MDVLPSLQQKTLMLDHDPHCASYFAAGHSVGPKQIGRILCPEQVDLGLAIPEDMDMRRLVIIDVDDHAQTVGTQHSDHSPK